MTEDQVAGVVSQEDEPEDEDTSQGGSPRPFDPNRIRVKKIDPTVSNLMEKLKADEIDLAPEFQRKKGIWDPGKRCRLIESLLIRIPLPAFYLDELPPKPGCDERYAVIDGVQRLTALEHFINDKTDNRLRLENLEFLTQLEGKTFDELDRALQRRILSAQFVAYVIEQGTPDDAKLNIFKRINTGGLSLTPQEIRHAMNPGPVRKFLENLVSMPEFVAAIGKTAAKMSQRMDDRECAIRFLAFIDDGVSSYKTSDTDLDGFLNIAMIRINAMSDRERETLAARFRRVMVHAPLCFGRHAFRKPTVGGRFNKALFEATTVVLDERSDTELGTLAQRHTRLIDVYRSALEDPQILASVTSSTGDPTRVDRRFSALRGVVTEVLK